jgi:Domain of unknown function (DUF4157)
MQATHQQPVPEPTLEQAASLLRGRGRPLPESTRRGLEHSSGRLLGHVRVHDDPLGSTLAESVAARAVTIGGDIAVGPGGAGQPRVLAHELAHAVRQSGTPFHGPLAPSSPGDAVEQAVGG